MIPDRHFFLKVHSSKLNVLLIEHKRLLTWFFFHESAIFLKLLFEGQSSFTQIRFGCTSGDDDRGLERIDVLSGLQLFVTLYNVDEEPTLTSGFGHISPPPTLNDFELLILLPLTYILHAVLYKEKATCLFTMASQTKYFCVENLSQLILKLDNILNTVKDIPDSNLSIAQEAFLNNVTAALTQNSATWSEVETTAESIRNHLNRSQSSVVTQDSDSSLDIPLAQGTPTGPEFPESQPLFSDSEQEDSLLHL